MEISGASLYEVNQQLSAQEKVMGPKQRDYWYTDIRIWFRDNKNYFMLLCHDRRDFTLFRVTESPADAATALFECIDNRG